MTTDTMTPSLIDIRPVTDDDYAAWRPLWEGYNAFYGRQGATALPEEITRTTWRRFLTPDEPVHALVATDGTALVGLVHYLFHRSTTRLQDVCYLQDLFTAPGHRGQRIGRRLIEAVYAAARSAGSSRVYWQTQIGNAPGRALYDQVAVHAGFIVYAHELASPSGRG
jgi:GNAT superfamily N-acetyltransferase